MHVQILGSGCERCKTMAAHAAEAAQKLGLQVDIEKVTDIEKITAYGVLLTPALVINGKVVKSGKVLSPDEIAAYLQEYANSTSTEATAGNPPPAAPGACCGGGGTPPAGGQSCGCGCSGGGKKMLTWLLLAFVAFSLVMVAVRNRRPAEAAAASASTPQTAGITQVYYFHGDKRCKTCTSIERLTREAINQAFARELAEGKIVFQTVNLDERANEHYIADFELSTRTVVIQQNGRFQHLDDVWTLTDNPEQFRTYIASNIRKMQEEKHEQPQL